MEKKQLGLTTHEAQKRLILYGKNILPHKKPVVDLILFLEQFKSPLIYILLIASIISLALGDYKDSLVILAAVLVNTILGFYQERKAQKALYALKQILTPQVKVIRDGKVTLIDTQNIVLGDVVMLTAGDRIPADGEVIEEVNIVINEAVLTGESLPVAKEARKKEQALSKNTQVFMGTQVLAGRGKILVTKTGLLTEFGKIASELTLTREESTPLQKRMAGFAKFLAIIFGILSAIIFCTGIISGRPFIEMFTTSVALAVAAIPEGMAVSLTVILAIGMQRILKRKAIVRRLVAAEALGSTTVIATDKTGTLTQGQMAVEKTNFTSEKEALITCALANNREDALEIAIWEYVQKQNLDPAKLQETIKRETELPFDAVRKFMAVLCLNNERTIYFKGAPEIILKHSSLDEKHKKYWLNLIQNWGDEGLRLIGLGMKRLTTKFHRTSLEKETENITWLGLVGIADPVRETVKESLILTRKAGISLKVITGDFEATGRAVLKKLGVSLSGEEILEGEEIEKLTQAELEKRVKKTILFARVTPMQKLRIVNALQTNGEVVALVGDGINDAPAIKAANIGIVVENASDVARQTADMVLLDSNFGTIISAIEEGRGIYENIKKVILYLLSDSFSEIILVFGAIILGLPLPLTAAQILWINIVTDGLPSLSLTVEPKEKNLLSRMPINSKADLLDNSMKALIIIISSVTGIFTLLLYLILLNYYINIELVRTIIFTSLALATLLYIFSVRILNKPLWQSNIFSNKWLIGAILVSFILQLLPLYNPFFQEFLETVPLNFNHWLIVLLGPLVVIALIEFIKIAIITPKRKASL